MKIKYRIEFTFFILLITLIPIFIYTVILNFEYKKNIVNRNFYYLETIRETNLKMLEQNYKLLINSVEFLIKTSKNKSDIKELDLEQLKNSSKNIEAVYTFDKNFKFIDSINNKREDIFSKERILNTVRNSNFSQKYFLENIDSEKPFNILVFNYFNNGYVAIILNHNIFNVIDVDKGFNVDIYNDKFRLIKSTYRRKLNIKEINKMTKKITEGLSFSEIIDGKIHSYSMLSMNGAEFYILVQNEASILIRFKQELLHYTIFILLLSLCLSFLISWRFLNFINTHIAKRMVSYDYDDYQIKKLDGLLSDNLGSVDRILKHYLDFQVLKNDLEEVKKGLAHRKEHVERDEKNENIFGKLNKKFNKINKKNDNSSGKNS